jgi:hypothetical protein
MGLFSRRTSRAVWTQDLDGETSVTAAPTSASDGIATTRNAKLRTQIAVDLSRTSGDATATVWVYGYDVVGNLWRRLEVLSQLNETGTDHNWVFQLDVGQAYSRIATRLVQISGTGAAVDTWIGFSA